MSLSSGTLLLFLLLIPGLIFRAALYQGAVVVRPIFASGALHSTVAVLFYSSAVYALSYALYSVVSHLLPGPQLLYTSDSGVVMRRPGGADEAVRLYFLRRPLWGVVALIAVCALAVAVAWVMQRLSFVVRPLGRMMYGPLALIFRKSDTIALCSIVTTEGEGHARMMYQGVPVEISLNDRNGVNHVVMKAAYRMTIAMDGDRFVAMTDKRERVTSTPDDLLMIDAEHIANVHFETFTATDLPAPRGYGPPRP